MVGTKYLLGKITEQEVEGYRQLCIKENKENEKYYVESFFYEKSDDYIKGQICENVKSLSIVSKEGAVYLKDSFI